MTTTIHPLDSPWGRFGLVSFFVDAPEPAIVDTGVASSPEAIRAALAVLGRDVADVRWILHTHGHIDHVGGTYALWEATGRRARVAIHAADADLLRSRRGIIAKNLAIGARYAPHPTLEADQLAQANAVISGELEPDLLLQGGEELDLGGVRLVVHHVPGHTAGSVAYELVGQGDLLVGDAVMMAGAASGFPGYDDPVDYRASLLRIRDAIAPRRLFLGHPYRWPDGTSPGVVLAGADVARALAVSLEAADRIAAAARRHLHGRGSAESPYGLFAAVADDLGFVGDPTHEPWSFFTTMHGHLTRHLAQENSHD